ncbi:hypothetical protein [Paenibacillus nanensis]|uniref:hypothetical protein n=1 Tax=Paenibacillus nanensis TaxID=393251 RepID=UPI0013C2A45C|nr:hypothetical protein [Paenibacillus nanensis]
MEQEKEIQELKRRIENLENQIQHKRSRAGMAGFGLSFIIVFVLLLVVIGIFQFIRDSN